MVRRLGDGMVQVRQWTRLLMVAGLALVCAAALAGCGGGSPDASKSASPSVSVSPSPTKPAVPAQPKGANGVTYHVVNWAKYANNPVVLAYKRTIEGYGASVNHGKVAPVLLQGMTKKVLRGYLGNIHFAWRNDLHQRPVGYGRVGSVTTSGRISDLVTCEWDPSFNLYKAGGKPATGKVPRHWSRIATTLTKRKAGWVISSWSLKGSCKGAAPR